MRFALPTTRHSPCYRLPQRALTKTRRPANTSHTEWHRAIVWGKLAEYAKTLTKGSHLQIEGELRSREYQEKKNGNAKRRVWEIRVDSILKLDRAEKASAEDLPAASAAEEVPF